jgi:hypothetical protein
MRDEAVGEQIAPLQPLEPSKHCSGAGQTLEKNARGKKGAARARMSA